MYGFRPFRNASAAGFIAASIGMTMPANAESLAPDLPPNAPSAVYKVTNAELDTMLQKLGALLEKQGPFDALAFAENHCYPQLAQLSAADQTIALYKRFHISAVATEYADDFNTSFVDNLLSKPDDKELQSDWKEMVVGGLGGKDCRTISGLSNKVAGDLEGQGEIDAVRKMAANNMLWYASDFSYATDKYVSKTGKILDYNNFVQARLDEKEAAKQIAGAINGDRIAITRGSRHFLQYDPNALEPQLEKYGKKLVTVAFDYTGHDVSDTLTDVISEGYKARPPDIVMDWKSLTVYAWPKPEASLAVKQSSLEPSRSDEAVAQAQPLAAARN